MEIENFKDEITESLLWIDSILEWQYRRTEIVVNVLAKYDAPHKDKKTREDARKVIEKIKESNASTTELFTALKNGLKEEYALWEWVAGADSLK